MIKRCLKERTIGRFRESNQAKPMMLKEKRDREGSGAEVGCK